MKKTLLSLALVASASLLLTGCGDSRPAVNPANVPRVDPLAAQAQSNGGTAAPAPADGELSLAKNYYFVIDGSGSMGDRPPRSASGDKRFNSKMEGAKWAAKETVSNLPDDVNIGLFVFDSYGTREVLALGPKNKQKFLSLVDQIYAGGGTPLGASISAGTAALVKQYQKQLGYGEFRLFVLTDGDSSDNLNNGVVEAAKYGIPIYTIGFGIGEGHALRQFSVSYKNADSAAEVQKALSAATAELEVYDPANFKK